MGHVVWVRSLNSNVEMPPNYQVALRRLEGVERKMKRNPKFQMQYKQAIDAFVAKGYAKKLSLQEAELVTRKTFYLPHFVVQNPNKNKLRIVFDAAAEVGGISLNKQLLAGPDLNKPLLAVLMNFRLKLVVICGDIREMFLQVRVAPEDQDAQRFWWRDGDSTKEVQTHVMQSMLFGATCSPTLAQFVKNTNALKFAEKHKRAVIAITECHYVDDYVDCFDTEEQAIEIIKDVIMIHQQASFELTNFCSNSTNVMKALSASETESDIVSLNDANVERVLGMHWNIAKDSFMYVLKFHTVSQEVLQQLRKPSKREVLSLVMSIFDPFGLLANFVVTGKLLMQKLWVLGIAWDEPLPDDLYGQWKKWLNQLVKVQDIQVPRCYNIDTDDAVDLQVFADASESAVAAVAYLRQERRDGAVVRFVLAKTRCTPIKYTSVPRLELQAAVLAVRVKELILVSCNLTFREIYFWTESTTVLCWIISDSRCYKQYVASRLGEILEHSQVKQWHWVPSALNVADDGTRENLPQSTVKSFQSYQTSENTVYLPDADADIMLPATEPDLTTVTSPNLNYFSNYTLLRTLQDTIVSSIPGIQARVTIPDKHHYALGYLCLALAIAIMIYLYWKQRPEGDTKTSPETSTSTITDEFPEIITIAGCNNNT